MAVTVVRMSMLDALAARSLIAPDRPEVDEQIIAGTTWGVMRKADGAWLALTGVLDTPDARLLWLVTSPALRRHVRSFLAVAGRFLRQLADERPVLVETTAPAGARLAWLLGAERLVRCNGAEYWLVERET